MLQNFLLSTFHFPLRKRPAFTLIELLVVVSIIAVLTSIGLAVFTSAQKKARDARRQADLEAVRSALELYRADNPTVGYPNNTYTYATLPLSTYINPLPPDPKPSAAYTYTGNGTGTTYMLCATQEVILPANYCLSPP